MNIQAVQIVIPTSDLNASLDFFTKHLGFRLEMIMPADSPTIAVVSGHGSTIRFEASPPEAINSLRLRLHCNYETINGVKDREIMAPGGIRIEFVEWPSPIVLPPLKPEFIITRMSDENAWTTGRAGMQYRDLIPGKLGGAIIASHIRIPEGGETPDYVHYHRVLFQMIYCKAGWARLVYEDQGPPFIMNAGDCVLQPPGIRHRVLETSPGFEVIELGCPAMHETFADHDMQLPTSDCRPEKIFGGQRFVHHIASEARWIREETIEKRDTGISEATDGLADVRILRGSDISLSIQTLCDFSFYHVLSGEVRIKACGDEYSLSENDCCAIPKGTEYAIKTNDDVRMLHIQIKLP